jgi:hypothetical protein
MLKQNLLKKKTVISSREINIGSCSGVNMCHKLGHIDFWDTTFAFVLRHIIVSAFVPARTKYELKTRGLLDMAAGRRDSQDAPLYETDVARRTKDRKDLSLSLHSRV